MNEDGDNNETESETTDMACVSTTAVAASAPVQDVPKIKTDISEQGKCWTTIILIRFSTTCLKMLLKKRAYTVKAFRKTLQKSERL